MILFRLWNSGALPIDPVDRINEIEDDIDNLEAIEQIPGEAKFYRTSTETYDDFVPPQIDVSDNETDGEKSIAVTDKELSSEVEPENEPPVNQPENEPPQNVPEIKALPQDVGHEGRSTEPPVIDGLQFLDFLKFFAELGGSWEPGTQGSVPMANDDAVRDTVQKSKKPTSEATTVRDDSIEDGTTELHVPRPLKRPTISQTVKDVLHAFKALHNWRFTK